MRSPTGTIALILALASSALAQDGGKLSWRGRGGEDPKAAMADALRDSKPMMLFFTSQGNDACSKLSAGAFSDAAVIQAAESLSCILVECDSGRANRDLCDHYKVQAYPTVLLCDPWGKTLSQLGAHEPAAKMAKQILDVAGKKHVKLDPAIPTPKLAGKSPREAMLAAKRFSRPALLYFSDDSPGSLSVSMALMDDLLKGIIPRFIFGKAEYKKGSDECAFFDVTRAPTILILDCSLEKPETKPMARISGSRSPRELRRDLESVLSGVNEDGSSASKPPGSNPAPRQPDEKLSDDEVERRFIQARISVAQELLKKGKKDQAIEIYEDLIKSYPKHAETQSVKILLDEARK